jgi:hypothetical protein
LDRSGSHNQNRRTIVTDDDEYQTIRAAARRKLDAAISEYAATINNAHGDPDIMGIVGAWIVAVYSPTTEEGRDCYVVESAVNQPYHVSIGMAQYAQSHYVGMGVE